MPGVEDLPSKELGDFSVDRYEVTNRAYRRFVEAGGYQKPDYWKEPFVEDGRTLTFAEAMARFRDKTRRPGPATWEVGDYPEGQADHPVTGVSWYEASAYATFAGQRLPSVYHWDRVALTWASGEIVPLSNLSGSGLVRTGGIAAMNRFGAYDLAGNAREWCANPSSRGGRFILGGGWNDPPYAFNDAYAQSPWDRSETNGFRCIQPADTSAPDARLEATIPLPFRDFKSEPRVSDETFALFLNQYRYDATPLHATVEETLEEEDYRRERISFDAAYGGERMTAYLFLPRKGRPPFQTVVLFPGSGAIHTRSSASLAPGGFLFLLKSGRALFQPVYKSTYERGDGLASDYPAETSSWRDHVVMWGKDLRRSIDYLETRPDIDADRPAYLGYSWGAAMGPIMMAVEPRLKVGIVVVAGLNFQRALREVDEVHYAPRVKIPVLMLNGKYDFFFPYETSQLPFFELLGTARPHKKLVVHETSHAFPRTDLARESLAWLDEHLGPPAGRP
jgi:dienelactone hydrolase